MAPPNDKAANVNGATADAEDTRPELPDLDAIDDSVELRETAEWLRNEVVEARNEAEENLDTLRRLKAEFDNYRKRMLREQSEVVARASKSLISSILPALDSLDMLVEHANDATKDDPLFKNMSAVRSQIIDILDKEGLERIAPPNGTLFDPTVHEPVAATPGDGGETTVTKTLRAGFRLKGQLLRPAMVEVTG